jgi:serine-type D-Ala-D-Ala carboxypeptidase (penicillin-binding protein 5/6)
MRRAPFLVVAAAAVVALLGPVQASSADSSEAVRPPQISARAWYLVGEDGAVLAQRNARQRRAVASITKLMTAIVAVERSRLSDVVTVSSRAASVGGSTVFLRAGERVTVSALLRGMLVASANDAAYALADHAGRGSVERFVALMNAKARDLGLDETRFANPHGLDEPGHLSSAEDATLLVQYALGIPFIRDALARNSVSFPGDRVFATTDDLLASWPPLIGGKTGHTASAGWSEAAAARGRGVTVYGTVLGSAGRTERNDALQDLLSYGLARYRRIAAIDSSRVYARSETGYGRPVLELVAPRTLLRTVRENTPLVERVMSPGVVDLPVRKGQRLGRVEVYEGSRLVARSQLVAASSVSEPGVLAKVAWYAERTADHLWELVS